MIGRTPNIFVVGAGPVATTLAGALRRSGVPVLGLWARDPAASRAAGSVAGVVAYSAAPPDLLLEAEVVIVAVRDDAISEVARTLVGTGLVSKRHVLLHCSGALSSEAAFAGVAERIGGRGLLHPLRAIPDARAAIGDLKDTIFGIEGDEEGRWAARVLCEALGGQPLELAGERVASYHAAAAIASNYVVTLLDLAAGLLEDAGIDRDDALPALAALAGGAVDNVRARGLPAGLTGPIRRGDRATIARHLQALEATPETAELYRLLGRRALAMARACGDADPGDLEAIDGLLDAAVDEPLARSGS